MTDPQHSQPASDATLYTCWTTVPTESDAQRIAQALVDEQIAACVQIDSPIQSVYLWEGERQSSEEYRLWIKTLAPLKTAARERVRALHPYDTPQWIEIRSAEVDEKYLKWAKEASNLRGFPNSEPI